MNRKTIIKIKILFATFICWLATNSIANHHVITIWTNKTVSTWSINTNHCEKQFMDGANASLTHYIKNDSLFLTINWLDEGKRQLKLQTSIKKTSNNHVIVASKNIDLLPNVGDDFWAELWFNNNPNTLIGDLLLESKDTKYNTRIKFAAIHE
jgi:hypothetical protein